MSGSLPSLRPSPKRRCWRIRSGKDGRGTKIQRLSVSTLSSVKITTLGGPNTTEHWRRGLSWYGPDVKGSDDVNRGRKCVKKPREDHVVLGPTICDLDAKTSLRHNSLFEASSERMCKTPPSLQCTFFEPRDSASYRFERCQSDLFLCCVTQS